MNDLLTKPVPDDAEDIVVSDMGKVADPSAYDPEALAMIADSLGEDGIIELLQMFHDSARAALPAMSAAVESGDFLAVQQYAHSLKSSAAQVGAIAFSQLAATLETRLRMGGTCSDTEVVAMREALAKFASAACLTQVDPS